MAIVVGCIGDETAINIAHLGGISEFILRNNITQQLIPKRYTRNARALTEEQEGSTHSFCLST